MKTKYFPSEIEAKWPQKKLTSSRGLHPRVGGAFLRGKQKGIDEE